MLICFTYIDRFPPADRYWLLLAYEKYILPKSLGSFIIIFGVAILFLCYKQPVSIYKGKFYKVGKTDEDLTWWP